jgi:predicted permease
MINDLRYALRQLRKDPGFTAVAVLSLALGIGANTAIFGLIDAVLLKNMPVKDPKELVQVIRIHPRWGVSSLSYPAFERFRDHNRAFTGMFAVTGISRMKIHLNGQTEQVDGQFVSGTFYSVLGVGAVHGRTFTADDDRIPGGHPVAVLSYSYWKRRFALDPSVVGKTLTLDRTLYTVIGVTPPEFFGVSVGRSPDVYLPMKMQTSFVTDPLSNWLQVMARLTHGVIQEQAQAELAALFSQHLTEIPMSGWTLHDQTEFRTQRAEVIPAGNGLSDLRRQFSKPLWILMAVVGLVLLISCANVANLLLARATARQKEIAVRLAIGAGRGRLIRQFLTESILLAALAGSSGLLLAYWTGDLLVAFMSRREATLVIDLHPDLRILLFTVGISVAAGILFGLAPALRASSVSLTPALKQETLSDVARRFPGLGRALVISQVALSLFLLIGAGLFIRTLQNLKTMDAGFKRENLLLFTMDGTESGYKGIRLGNLYQQVLERLKALPDVRGASMSLVTPIEGGGWSNTVWVRGYAARPDEDMNIYLNRVGPGFFETLGLQVLQGRDFDERDHQNSAKVALINETMAHYFFGTENPIGKHFGWGDANERSDFEIVGVVKDAKYLNLRAATPRTAYVYAFQDLQSLDWTHFEVRTMGNPNAIISRIRAEIQSIDRSLTVSGFRTLDQQVNESLREERLIATLSSTFGVLALLLASIGLYGTLSYAVSRRMKEIGIRMALGARQPQVLWMILKETLALVLMGIAIGLPAALLTARLLSTMLFGLTPTDRATFSLAIALLTAVTLLAGYLPARRATKVDPMVALRCE